MLRRFYLNILALSASRNSVWWLAGISFAESSFFPIPPDVLLIPMVVARPDRAWRYAAVCTLASVVGGMLGYAIGYALFDQFAEPLIRFYHYQQAFSQFKTMFAQYGLWVILIKGLTPIPYKIVTIASGAAQFNFGIFILASLATRGVRFFLLAGLLRSFGEPIRVFVERRLTLVTSVVALSIIGGFVALKFF
jgi:membrane protein YqaA with SNARE-associated domain